MNTTKISSKHVALLNALDEFKSIGRAATAINTTQPAASLLLQQLEERLGVKLFERLPHGMLPTTYGNVMIRCAKNVIHDFEYAEGEISELSKGAAGLVKIGSVIGSVPQLLTKALISFKEENPNVRLSIEVNTSDLLMQHLIRGDIDFLLGRVPDQMNHRDLAIDFLKINEQFSAVIARPRHQLTKKKKLKLSDLAQMTWILHPIGSPSRYRVENALRTAEIVPNSLDIIECTSILLITSLISASDMISVFPQKVAEYYENYGMVEILPVKLPFSMNIGILTKKTKLLSPAAQCLIEHIKSGAEKIVISP